MRFIHMSDVHLGYQQYGLNERYKDFARAFDAVITYAIEQKVDAILIGGDLFHKSAIEPSAYLQATTSLSLTRNAGIAVIVIEGNHDQIRYRDQLSWLDVLAREGYIYLLRTAFPQDQPCALMPWNRVSRSGSYINIQNVRIVGLQWLGASLPALFPDFVQAFKKLPQDEGINFTIVLTHAAFEGEIAKVPTYLMDDQLHPLENLVQYFALGHLHKPFQKKDWAYNPGSLEVYDTSEIKWDKGWYDVEVSPEGEKKVSYLKSKHRPFFSEDFFVNSYANPSALYSALLDRIRKQARVWNKCKDQAVVEIRFIGNLSFDRLELDLKRVEDYIREEAAVCHVLVNTSNMGSPGLEATIDESLPQDELELSVLRQIAEADSRFAPRSEQWARGILEVKRMALSNHSPDEILSMLQTQIEIAEEKNANRIN